MTEPLVEKKRIETTFGRIAYLETGSDNKPPVLFVHGIPTSGYLWRDVIRFLQNDFHCYAPDLVGLGDTEVEPGLGRYTMDAQAEMLVEMMQKLGHDQFAIVCHDQGGAATQLIAAHQPDRLTCLVITNCVCYDNWPVPVIKRYQSIFRWRLLADLLGKAKISELIETRTPLSAFRRGVYRTDRLAEESIREYLRPIGESPAGRERFRRFLLAGDSRYTETAVAGLRAFTKPTMVIWGADDHYLSPSWGRKLFSEIPGAKRFELVPFAGHFWQEECPSEFSSVIGAFLSEHLRAGAEQEELAAKAACPSKRAPKSATESTLKVIDAAPEA